MSVAAFAQLKADLDARHRETLAQRLAGLDSSLLQTGIAQIDQAIGGGLVRGTIASLEGAVSSGRTALAARLLAAATRAGLAAVIDDGSLYPPGLVKAGVLLERLLIMPAGSPLGIARAADILLRSRAFGVVLLPAPPLRAAIWTRLASLAHHANAIVIALSVEASNELAYFSTLRLQCGINRVLWTQRSGILCELAGYDVRVDVLKNKRAAPGTSAQTAVRYAAVC